MSVHLTAERVDALNVKLRRRCIPFTASIELTHRCNLRCRLCYLDPDRGPELTSDEVFSLIDQLEAEGTLLLNLTGGEILLRNDLWEIVAYGRSRNFAVGLLTNGTLIDDSAADRIADLGVLDVGVSVYAHCAELHDLVTGVPGSFDASTRALRLLVERGVDTRLKCVLMNMNSHYVKEIMQLAGRLGARAQFDSQLTPRNDGDRTPLELEADEERLREMIAEDALSLTPEQFAEEPPCAAGRDMVSVGPTGSVYPCVQMPLRVGSIRERPFHEIWWESEPLASLRAFRMSDIERCAHCPEATHCRPCLGLNLVENGDMAVPAPITCRTTHIRGEVPRYGRRAQAL